MCTHTMIFYRLWQTLLIRLEVIQEIVLVFVVKDINGLTHGRYD